MDPKWCQNVTQDGSFHGTQDGVCGYTKDRNQCSAVIIVPGASGTAPGPPGAPPGHRYHLGSHFGTILGPFGDGLGGFKTVFLVILGLLKFVQNSNIKPHKTCYFKAPLPRWGGIRRGA